MISIIIPTRGNRPALLKRAVESALSGHKSGEIEVIVVPNGPEHHWQRAITDLAVMTGVHIQPIIEANVSAARNHGLCIASGELVRFLDDDDYLVPDIAVKQCKEMLASGADVSSYAIRIEDESGNIYSTLAQPVTPDFVSGQLGRSRLQIPIAHVYRRALIQHLRWNEKYSVSEDILWLHSVSQLCRIDWIKCEDVVGVWYQHKGSRLSYTYPAHEPNRITAESTLHTVETITRQSCINDERRMAAAAGLWVCIHKAFYLHPFYWHAIAKSALDLDPASHPDTSLYNPDRSNRLNPLLIEWMMLPKRVFTHLLRSLRGRLFGWNHVRHL